MEDTPVFLPGESHRAAWEATVFRVCRSQTWLSAIFFSGRYKRLPYSFCYEDFFPNLLHKGSEVPQTQHYILPPPASPLNPLQTSSEECLCHPHLTSVFSIAVAEKEISPAVRTPLPDHSCLHATRHFIDGEADTPDSGGGSRGSQSSGRGRGSGQLGCSKRLLPTKYVQPRWLEVKSRQSKTDFKKEHAVLVRWHSGIQAQAVKCNMIFSTELLLFQKPV